MELILPTLYSPQVRGKGLSSYANARFRVKLFLSYFSFQRITHIEMEARATQNKRKNNWTWPMDMHGSLMLEWKARLPNMHGFAWWVYMLNIHGFAWWVDILNMHDLHPRKDMYGLFTKYEWAGGFLHGLNMCMATTFAWPIISDDELVGEVVWPSVNMLWNFASLVFRCVSAHQLAPSVFSVGVWEMTMTSRSLKVCSLMRRAVSGMWSLMMSGDRSSVWRRETERGGWWLGGWGVLGTWLGCWNRKGGEKKRKEEGWRGKRAF